MFDLLVEEKRRAGLRAGDAHRAATLELGRVAAIKDEIRDARAGAFVDTWLRDIRYAWRGMRRDPRFTIVVVFSLAIGIGSTTAVFTVFNVTLLQPLSSPDAASSCCCSRPSAAGSASCSSIPCTSRCAMSSGPSRGCPRFPARRI